MSNQHFILILGLVSIFSSSYVSGLTQLGNCKAQLDDGSVIDLKPLDNPGSPLTDTQPDFEYKFNPCTNFQCGDAGQTSLCEKLIVYTLYVPLGDADKVVLSMPEDKLLLTYSTDNYGDSVVQCECTKDATSFKFLSSTPGGSNLWSLSSTHCCASSAGGSGSGTSFGTILLIIVLVCGCLYLVVGALYMFQIRKARGVEVIPNYTFWSEIPSNIKDGVLFVNAKIRGTASGKYEQI